MQSKRQILFEAVVNVFVGYWVAVGSQVAIYPWFGIRTTSAENYIIAFWFTLVSLLRSYLLRRFFNLVHGAKLRSYFDGG